MPTCTMYVGLIIIGRDAGNVQNKQLKYLFILAALSSKLWVLILVTTLPLSCHQNPPMYIV